MALVIAEDDACEDCGRPATHTVRDMYPWGDALVCATHAADYDGAVALPRPWPVRDGARRYPWQ